MMRKFKLVLAVLAILQRHVTFASRETCTKDKNAGSDKSTTTDTTTAGECTADASSEYNNWDSILNSSQMIMNGCVWPPNPKMNSKDNCLLLLTHSFVLKHCPNSGEEVVFRNEQNHRFRGVFTVPSSLSSRIWVLSSPAGHFTDLLEEIDVELGKVVQILRVPDTQDGHDAVRFGDSVFIVDTRHGDIVEIALPVPAVVDQTSDYESIDIKERISTAPEATVIQRHKGFTRADHVNNVAIHSKFILANLHGDKTLKKKIGLAASSSRLSLIERDASPGDELYFDHKSDLVVDTVGNLCHNIAFFEEKVASATLVKLISLDSMNGALVSVVLSPDSKKREREILWTPDLAHPVLIAVQQNRYGDMEVFSKGLTVQGGVAYFGVSGARRPVDRTKNFSTLLVAYDLVAKRELWVRTIDSKGLVNQVVSMEYLNTNCAGDNCLDWPASKEGAKDEDVVTGLD